MTMNHVMARLDPAISLRGREMRGSSPRMTSIAFAGTTNFGAVSLLKAMP
jgi:hypothetical protein